jgi:hypothetical protein
VVKSIHVLIPVPIAEALFVSGPTFESQVGIVLSKLRLVGRWAELLLKKVR